MTERDDDDRTIAVPNQLAVVIYLEGDQVVIEQKDVDGQDACIYIHEDNLSALIEALGLLQKRAK